MSFPVATFLPPALTARVDSALRTGRLSAPTAARLIRCESSADLIGLARVGQARVVVADPMQEQGKCSATLMTLRNQFPSMAVVLYFTAATPASALRLADLTRHGMHDAIFFEHGDRPQALAGLLARVHGSAASNELLTELAPELSRLPQAIRETIVRTFENPQRFSVVEDVARDAGVSRRTVYNSIRAAGISSPRQLLLSGRALKVVSMLQNTDRSVASVAVSLGFSSSQRLTSQLMELAGMRISDVRAGVNSAALVSRIAESLRDVPQRL
jgi:AraC-like DNA-binding protein